MRTILLIVTGLLLNPLAGMPHTAWAKDVVTKDAPATALPAGTLEIARPGAETRRLTVDELKALPATTIEVTFTGSKGEEKASYRGVLLWTLLESLGAWPAGSHHGELRQAVVVTGQDGYRILFSGGEISPLFGNRQIVVAYERDGQPIANTGIRLAVPGDTRGARSVRDVVSIAVTEEAKP